MSNLATIPSNGSSRLVHQPLDRQAAIYEAVERRNLLVEFTKMVMVESSDYGKVPGTDKNTLFKPGAEKLNSLFGYHNRLEVVEKAEDWTGDEHNGEPFFYYWYRVALLDRDNKVVATGDGSCNSWEGKYRYRNGERKCPECGQPTIFNSKPEQGGGYYCWSKKGGCGAKFSKGDSSIEEQVVGKVPNPDIFSQVNTIQKMAYKRALVAATLLATNASEFFTQDMEDFGIIDVGYTPVPSKQPEQVEHVDSNPYPSKTYISEPQRKRWYALTKGRYTEGGLRELLAHFGCFNEQGKPSGKAIPIRVYDNLCVAAQDDEQAEMYNAKAVQKEAAIAPEIVSDTDDFPALPLEA